MSTCPEKDIHSIYLDNELPPAYVPEYEMHIASCTICRSKLLKLKQLSSMLHSDADRISFPSAEMSESFIQLQTKLRFSDTSRRSRTVSPQLFKWALPAAAIFAFALVAPLGMQRNTLPPGTQTVQASVPISIPASALGSALATPAASGFLPKTLAHQVQNTNMNTGSYMRNALSPLPYDANADYYTAADNLFATVDIFRPEFENSNRISVKITLTNLGELPITTEFTVPAWNSSGNQTGIE